MSENKLDKLKKIKELALRGSTPDERSAAQSLLNKLSKKYEVSFKELEDSKEIDTYDFWFHGSDEKSILVQVMYKVTNTSAYYEVTNTKTRRLVKTLIRKDCTKSQKLEIEFLFEFYKRLWYKEKEYFKSAFIQKHELFGNSRDSDSSDGKYSLEEILKIKAMERGLSDESPLLAIESGELSD